MCGIDTGVNLFIPYLFISQLSGCESFTAEDMQILHDTYHTEKLISSEKGKRQATYVTVVLQLSGGPLGWFQCRINIVLLCVQFQVEY